MESNNFKGHISASLCNASGLEIIDLKGKQLIQWNGAFKFWFPERKTYATQFLLVGMS